MSESLAPDAAQAPAGSPSPDPNDAPPAASEPAAAAPEPAVGSEAPAIGETPATPPESDATPVQARKPTPDRIKELVAERNFLRSELQRATTAKQAEPAKPAEPEVEPTLEQHGHDVEAWSKAFTQYHKSQAAKAVEQHLSRVEGERQAQTITQQFAERETSFATATPDYAEAVSDPSLQQYVTPTISEVVVTSEYGPQLSYYLSQHRDELAKIAKMRPVQQAMALERITAKLPTASTTATPSAPKPKPVQPTRAPAPPTPVGNGSAPTKTIEQMTIGEYMEHRQRWANRS